MKEKEREVLPMYVDKVDDGNSLDEIPVLGNHWSWEGLMETLGYCKTIVDDPTKWEDNDVFMARLYEELNDQ